MAATWRTYLVRTHGLAGAGQAMAEVPEASEIRVLLGAGPAASESDPTLWPVQIDPVIGWAYFYGGPTGEVVASWWAKVAGVWEAGPVVAGVDLSHHYGTLEFPWPKQWVISTLQTLAKSSPPWPDRQLRVTGAFPRDPQTWPILTVRLDEANASNPVVGDALVGGVLIGSDRTFGRNTEVRISVVGWCATAEDREDLAQWLGSAMLALADQAPFYGFQEPSYTLSESEEMDDALGVPIFVVSASITGSRWAVQTAPVHSQFGQLTVGG